MGLLSNILRLFSRKFFKNFLFYGPIVTIILSLAFWVYLSTESITGLISINEARQEQFHYIVIGGGTAGCILASKLTENPSTNVLLIEAGNIFSPVSMVPLLTTQQQKTAVDWQLETTSQKHSSIGLVDQVQFVPRGKGLGGSSMLNYMLHYDTNSEDVERWEPFGASNWNFIGGDTKRTFLTPDCSSNGEDVCSSGVDQGRSHLKKLPTTPITYDYSVLSSKFVEASVEALKTTSKKLNFYLTKYNTYKGLRYTTYHSYLKPAFSRTNLKVLLNTRVHRIVFDKKKMATGVMVSDDNFRQEEQFIPVKNEIILSAGTFHSPQLLKLSGIGPKKELERFKIKTKHNSPQVGRNLYDHLMMPLYVTVNETMSITRAKVLSVLEIMNYMLHGEGIFSNFGVIGYLVDGTKQFSTGLFGVGSIDERVLRKIVNYEKETFEKNFPFFNVSDQEGFVLLNMCNRPLSRGTVRLNSKHIQDPPTIDPHYLEHKADIECMIRAIHLSEKLLSTDTSRKVDAKIHWPRFDQCRNFEVSEDRLQPEKSSAVNHRYLECIIRVGAVTAHHPGGTCAVGSSNTSVIDNQMRVRGVKKLRIVDASIIPVPVSGNPHATIASVAELAAQIIINGI